MRHIAILLASTMHLRAFANDVVETIFVKGTDGKPLRISADDYNEEKHGKPLKLNADLREIDEAPVETAGTTPSLAPGLELPPAPSTPPSLVADGTAVAPSVPSPNQRLVVKDGAKFYVVDAAGKRIEMDGIDARGYKTDAEAYDAILKLPH